MHLLRHGFASLRRTPTLALTIIATLGIALAGTVIVFSFLNSFILRPLPYGDADHILAIFDASIKAGNSTASRPNEGELLDILDRAKSSFSRFAYMRNESVTVHAGNAVEVDFVQRVNADVFPLMGLRAALGSVITSSNLQTGGVRAVVLSDALWRRRFGADRTVIGSVVQMEDKNYQIVGVMGPDFRTPSGDDNPQAWLALLPEDLSRNNRFLRRYNLWGLLAPGHSLGAAAGELDALGAALRQEYGRDMEDRTLIVASLRDTLLGNFGQLLLLLQGAVLLVLVVACFNCLCLLIARAIQRRREFAVRLALGAARRHLLAQLLAESVWLALPAAALACSLAELVLPLGTALLPAGDRVNLLPPPHIDATVVAAVVAMSLLVAFVFSLVPLLQTRRLNLETELRQGARSAGSPAGAKLARFLVGMQIAVTLALLISAALLARSQRHLAQIDPGFPVNEFDQFRLGLRGSGYQNPAARLVFYDRVLDNLRAIPGVRGATAGTNITTSIPGGYSAFTQEGDGFDMTTTPKHADVRALHPSAISVMGLRILEGRDLAETDTAEHPSVTLVSASAAAKYWPGQSPIGKRVQLGLPASKGWYQIVGVVSDVLGYGNQPAPTDGFTITLAQASTPGLGMGFYVRTAPGFVIPERLLQNSISAVDPTMQFFAHISPAQQYAVAAWQSRFVTQLVVAFALVAVLLSLAGIYAVNSFFVARRTSEFGIRTALGATRADLIRLVLGSSLRTAGWGLLGGVVLAVGASFFFASLLFAVPVLDPLTYAAAVALMAFACVAATLIPARRAAKVDPIIALRTE